MSVFSDSAEKLLCVVAGPLRVATRTARRRQPKWCRTFDNYIDIRMRHGA